jgi:uncharacterized repeat protein (TIGR03803 family)
MKRTSLLSLALSLFCLLVLTATAASAQTFNLLATFDGDNGSQPGSLVQGLDGNLYGTTGVGGAYQSGTVFQLTPAGSLTTLSSFCRVKGCPDGQYPGELILAGDGNFYGGTAYGGTHNYGTIFRITAAGVGSRVYNFCAQTNCSDGTIPSGLVQSAGGTFFGTTLQGGGNAGSLGTIFSVSGANTITTLHTFCSQLNCPDGGYPNGAIQAVNGNFYGTTSVGGSSKNYEIYGTIFGMAPNGTFKTLYRFCSQTNCSDGYGPVAGLVQGSDGNLYGVNPFGGNLANCFEDGCGTVFKITPSGSLTTLYTFCPQSSCPDGGAPFAGLIQANEGNFYGTTLTEGFNSAGTVFRTTPLGVLTTLYNFCASMPCTDGSNPRATLVQHTNGKIYGTTNSGGANGDGVVFSLDLGLSPFVEALPLAGSVGKAVKILGQGFIGTTSVSFNGTTASFTVHSDTYLSATVPSGATTGYITVNTPSGRLNSNKQFQVMP